VKIDRSYPLGANPILRNSMISMNNFEHPRYGRDQCRVAHPISLWFPHVTLGIGDWDQNFSFLDLKQL
jgi:hypothetical protein